MERCSTRRNLLRSLGATFGSVAVAGCIGDGERADQPNRDDDFGSDQMGEIPDDEIFEPERVTIHCHDFWESRHGRQYIEIKFENVSDQEYFPRLRVKLFGDEGMLTETRLPSTSTEAGETRVEFSELWDEFDPDEVTHYEIHGDVGNRHGRVLLAEYDGENLRENYDERILIDSQCD